MKVLNVLLSVFICSSALVARTQTISVNKENRTVAVTVTDDAEAAADVAVVTVGFTTYGTEQNQTYADATRTSNAIIDALHRSGIKESAIESKQQSLTAIDDDDKARYSKGLRFRFSQSSAVTVPAPTPADTLQTAITAGANESGGIEWKLNNDTELEATVANKALAHTQAVAEHYARALKSRLGSLIYASNQVPPRGIFGGALYTQSASLASTKPNLKSLAIVPEKVSRSATVYAVFAIE